MLAVGKMQFLQPCLPSHELGRLLGGRGEGEAGTVMLYLVSPSTELLSGDKALICVLGDVEVLQCCRQGPRCGYFRRPEVKDKMCK